ncbi:MAG: hypothetical protein GY754_36185 [bacterium]|nr:hypothetical protein [bacterium]
MKIFYLFLLSIVLFAIIFCGCNLDGNAISRSTDDDTIPPAVTITSPTSGNTYGSGSIVIQGKASDDIKILKVETCIDDGPCTEANSRGFSSSSDNLEWISFVETSTLSDGPHTITARAIDLWDNVTTASISINVDNGTPLAVISGVPPVISDTTDLNVSVSGAGIVAYKYKLDTGEWSPETSVAVPITASGLGVGEHTLLIIGKKVVNSKDVWQDATTEVTKFVWSVNKKYYFTATDSEADDYYGQSVAVSSDGCTIVVGAPGDDDNGSNSGTVYVYSWTGSTWNQTELTPSNAGAGRNFGKCVAVSSDGSTVVVGAVGWINNGNSGYVYVFSRTGSSWHETKLIFNETAFGGDHFGYSLAVSSNGSTIVIGASRDEGETGCAYVYSRTGSTWNQTKLKANDADSGDYFGYSVAVSSDGSTVVVGAYLDMFGSAYVYCRTGSAWNQTAKLIAADGAGGDYLGRTVAVSSDGSTIVLSAYGDDDNGGDSGSVYVYNWTGIAWDQTKLIAVDGAYGDHFGWSVAVSSDGSTVVVGAINDDDNGESSGSAYVYNWTGSSWDQTKFIANDGAAGDCFGYSVAVSSDGSTVIVGAWGGQGSVHLFYP